MATKKYRNTQRIVYALYSDTSANEDNSFRNHIRYPKRDFPYVSRT